MSALLAALEVHSCGARESESEHLLQAMLGATCGNQRSFHKAEKNKTSE